VLARPGPKGKPTEKEFLEKYWPKHPELLKPEARWFKSTAQALRDAGYKNGTGELTVSYPTLKRWREAVQKSSS
jgi:hypothetical protein